MPSLNTCMMVSLSNSASNGPWGVLTVIVVPSIFSIVPVKLNLPDRSPSSPRPPGTLCPSPPKA